MGILSKCDWLKWNGHCGCERPMRRRNKSKVFHGICRFVDERAFIETDVGHGKSSSMLASCNCCHCFLFFLYIFRHCCNFHVPKPPLFLHSIALTDLAPNPNLPQVYSPPFPIKTNPPPPHLCPPLPSALTTLIHSKGAQNPIPKYFSRIWSLPQ